MASFYEMSLENDKEYVIGRYKKVYERPLGMWIIEFLDVDWKDLMNQCEAIYKDWASDIPVSQRLAVFCHDLYETMQSKHPLMQLFFTEELRYEVTKQFSEISSLSKEQEIYRDKLFYEKNLPIVRDWYPRDLIKTFLQIFCKMETMKTTVLRILDSVMPESTGDEEKSVVQRYFEFNRQDVMHMLDMHQLYSTMSPVFYFSIGNKVYDYVSEGYIDRDEEAFKTKKLLQAGRIYMLTDELPALTLWELDTICARNIQLRRCKNCGRWFIPRTVTNCYCDRVLPDNPDKTCKDVGAMSQYQRSVEQDEAKKLYRRVANSVQTYANRHKKAHPEYLRYYMIWQSKAKELMGQVSAGDISYENFEKIINHRAADTLSMGGELFELDD